LAVAVVWGVWPEGLRYPHLWLVLMVGLAANLLQLTYSLVEGSRTEHDRASGVQIVWTVYAVQTLGRLFTWNVEVQGGQTVVEEGPYRTIRHPSYTGALLLFGATPLVFYAWLVALPAWLALAVAFTRRIRLEEDLLRREIPGYAVYMERTGALWLRPGGRPAG
jgi:protein-S-isoprenylcysteine O-methyltransferase Ste14